MLLTHCEFLFSPTDPAGIADWSVAILDPRERGFIDYSGTGAPTAPISWNGRSRSGELVQAATDYPAVFVAADIYGNSASIRRVIPVDILVIREGDRLKIQISSINFAPNSADFMTFDPEQAAKNVRTLDRLAEILKNIPTTRSR